jgi:DNA polymerase-3 subunit beta
MTATVDARDLKSTVTWAARSLANRPVVPVMACIGLRVTDGRIVAHGWDWSDYTEATAPAIGDLDQVYVNGRTLADMCDRVDDEVGLTVTDRRLHLTAGQRKFQLALAKADDYPTLPARPDPVGTSSDLADAIRRVAPSAATSVDLNSDLAVLACVMVTATGGTLTATATDRYTLSVTSIDWDGDDFTANIPARRLSEVIGHLDDKVTVGVGNVFSLDDGQRYAGISLIDKPALNTSGLMPPSQYGHVDIDRAALLDAVKAVTPTVGKNQPIRLDLRDGETVITSHDDALGQSEAAIEASLNGDPQALHYSPDYLTRVAAGTPTGTIRIHLAAAPRKPILVTGVIDGETDHTTRHVVMPIRVND